MHVMYLAGKEPIKFLDEVVCSNDPPSSALKWNVRHLVEVETLCKKILPLELNVDRMKWKYVVSLCVEKCAFLVDVFEMACASAT